MSNKSEITDALTEFVKRKANVNYSLLCDIVSVDNTAKTCRCRPLNGDADIFNVRLIADKAKDGFIMFPTVSTTVMVTFDSPASAFVSMVSQVDEIHLAGVNYGGLAVVSDLVTRLNNIENAFNTLLAIYNAHTHPGVTVGAGITAVPLVPATNTVTITTDVMIESSTVYHGDGL